MTQSNFQLLYTVCMSVFAFIHHMGVIMGMLDSMRMCRAVMCMRYQMCVSMFMAMYQCISDDQDSPCDHYCKRNYKRHREYMIAFSFLHFRKKCLLGKKIKTIFLTKATGLRIVKTS